MRKKKDWKQKRKSLFPCLEEFCKGVSYEERRKRQYEKNKVQYQHYEKLTREELIIEYADKKSKYEYQKHYL